MPWCEDCARYFAPSAIRADGTCPSCGMSLESQRPAERVTGRSLDLRRLAAGADGDRASTSAPWHFKLLVVMLLAYLAWRVIALFTG
ncbi:MAG: hypothetical protein ACKOYG_03385 [Ilumatobacteraceae bacterium]